MNDTFDLTRATKFAKRQLYLNKNSLFIAFAAIVGLLLIITVLTFYFNRGEPNDLNSLYLVVMYFGGFIFSSRIFDELQSPEKAAYYLTLPVANAERLIVSWLLTAPLFVAFSMITIFLLNTIGLLVGGYPDFATQMSWLYKQEFWTAIAVYMVIQPVFMLGALTFRKYNVLKTLLALFLLQVGLIFYTGLVGWISLGMPFSEMEGFNGTNLSPSMMGFFENTMPVILHLLFWYMLAPFMLVVSFFKLKERQV